MIETVVGIFVILARMEETPEVRRLTHAVKIRPKSVVMNSGHSNQVLAQ